MTSPRLQALISKLRTSNNVESIQQSEQALSSTSVPSTPTEPIKQVILDKYGREITYNAKQQEAVSLATSGKSCVIIGPAGTGKTTSVYGITSEMISTNSAGIYINDGHKHLESGTPGIVICAFTRRAITNIKRNVPAALQANCLTVHKLLEYQPDFVEYEDESGEVKKKRIFIPGRSEFAPLSSTISVVIIEESSMLSTDLYEKLVSALPHKPQIIFLGDIQQLPPVFGPAILGFKLISLPVVELTEVYRQALDSPIISLAHRILSGIPILAPAITTYNVPSKLTIHPWKKKISDIEAMNTISLFFCGNKHTESDPKKQKDGAIGAGLFNLDEDIILMPYNKAFGTLELNKKIANYRARTAGLLTHEVQAGFIKHYFSVGDKVMYDKEDAVILSIIPNITYSGIAVAPPSKTLDYWGADTALHTARSESVDMSDEDSDAFLAGFAGSTEDRVQQASHVISIRLSNSDEELDLNKAAEVNSLLLGYALTVHKSQGSEWRKVFFLMHQSNATMISREFLYTGITRAREELYIICEPETFDKGILSQRVKGNTIAEKAQHFMGKLQTGENYERFLTI